MIQFNSKVMTFEEFRDEWLSDKSYIDAQTSGSTGSPKRIKLDKEFVAASARATNSFFSLGSCSRLHSCVAADFIGGKMMLVRSIISGGIFFLGKILLIVRLRVSASLTELTFLLSYPPRCCIYLIIWIECHLSEQ